jgi:hypothetical protein
LVTALLPELRTTTETATPVTHIQTIRHRSPFSPLEVSKFNTGIVGVGFLAILTASGIIGLPFVETPGWRSCSSVYPN